jgi:hypothetical protein
MFIQLSVYHMKILLGDFNAKLGRENSFPSLIGNKSVHPDSNDNGIRLVNFANLKNLIVQNFHIVLFTNIHGRRQMVHTIRYIMFW